MKKELWVKNGIVLTDDGFQQVNIKIKDEQIAALVKNEPELLEMKSGKVIDARACLVVPGFIDSHVHFNDPGRTDWEGIETGSRAAAMGGTTTIFDMPLNSSPSVISEQILREKREYLTSLS
ncbi:MAG: amidohydrolase family protein, partial [Bacillus sp. (in: firmicutes)]